LISQSSSHPEIRMGDCFTSRIFYCGQVHSKYITGMSSELSCRSFYICTILIIWGGDLHHSFILQHFLCKWWNGYILYAEWDWLHIYMDHCEHSIKGTLCKIGSFEKAVILVIQLQQHSRQQSMMHFQVKG
jgi:hypothetical protein